MTTPVAQAGKMVYRFEEGDASMADLLGGKGSNLCEMSRLGLPVPPGFVVSTQVCRDYLSQGQALSQGLKASIEESIGLLERAMGRGFGSTVNPLLVSVRSGASISMPGMMDTILNLGINDEIVKGLASMMGDDRPAYDAYRRFLQIFSEVALGVDAGAFEEILSEHKKRAGVALDHQLDAKALQGVISEFKDMVLRVAGTQVPEDPWRQLMAAVEAVFRSWNTPRAVFYRDLHGISHDMGTAVTVMPMVFGNLGPTSGTGVLFTRNPSTGAREVYGEFLSNAQGEDVVAGVRTPQQLSALSEVMPQTARELLDLSQELESHYRDVQDVEFTIESERLFILQTRNAKRTPLAAVKTAVDMANEGMISREEALRRVDPEEIVQLLVPQFRIDMTSEQVQDALFARGAGASPGGATGHVYLDADGAVAAAARGVPVILVRSETKPDDIHGIAAAAGVVTARGGVTSHAAVVTRGLGKPCIVGCEALQVDMEQRLLAVDGHTIREGEEISIDGTTGDVYFGRLETVRPNLEDLVEANTLLGWADQTRKLGVMANADTPRDAAQALDMGAEGIGLCRTEHMFLDPERLPAVRQILLNAEAYQAWCRDVAANPDEPATVSDQPAAVAEFCDALAQVRQLQTQDFMEILRVMGPCPVIIRLLDAPLHEFLPNYETLLVELTELRAKGANPGELQEKEGFLRQVDALREANPMLGHRGCRLGLSFPAIYRMQGGGNHHCQRWPAPPGSGRTAGDHDPADHPCQ